MAEDAPTAASSAAAATPAPSKPSDAKEPSGPKEPSDAKKPSGAKHSAWIWIVLVLVVLGAVIGFVIYKSQKKPPPKVPPPVTISTTNAVKGDIDEVVWGLGTVTPIYTAMISPRVDGTLVKVSYTEGQMVTTNDLLAEIDPGPYAAMLTEAEGQLARDKALLEGANIDLSRYEDAFGRRYGTNLHAIPQQQVDDQRALVHQDEGTVKFDQGQVANAKVQLAYCFIHAPIAGRTGLRLVDPGNVVHAANTNAIVVIAQLQPITVIFGVDQKYLASNEKYVPSIQRELKTGHIMTVEAYNEDKTQKLATGTFQTLDNLIDTSTGNIRIKALFDNADAMLFPNEFVNAKLITETLSNVTLIPTAAIQRSPAGAFVYLLTNQAVNVTNVTNHTVTVATNQIVITNTITVSVTDADISSVEGLDPGQIIATDNFNKLADGMTVKVRPGGGARPRGGAPGGKKQGGKKDEAKEETS
jgi:multidrug efflux system membrane fusion protein